MFYSDEKYATLVINAGTVGVATADCTVECHNGSNGTVNLFCGFCFVCLDVSRRVRFDVDVIHHPTQHRMPAVSQFFLHRKG